MSNESSICIVCSEEVIPSMEAWCDGCGNVFHLNQREDIVARDCGNVWIDNESLVLQFGCNRCIEAAREGASAGQDDVLDLDEAAAAAGMDSAALLLLAQQGTVPHRKTASGTYLFVRRDLTRLASGKQS